MLALLKKHFVLTIRITKFRQSEISNNICLSRYCSLRHSSSFFILCKCLSMFNLAYEKNNLAFVLYQIGYSKKKIMFKNYGHVDWQVHDHNRIICSANQFDYRAMLVFVSMHRTMSMRRSLVLSGVAATSRSRWRWPLVEPTRTRCQLQWCLQREAKQYGQLNKRGWYSRHTACVRKRLIWFVYVWLEYKNNNNNIDNKTIAKWVKIEYIWYICCE